MLLIVTPAIAKLVTGVVLAALGLFAFLFFISLAIFRTLATWRTATFQQTESRRLPGLCAACSYDLRATLTRCPKCGAVSEKHAGFNLNPTLHFAFCIFSFSFFLAVSKTTLSNLSARYNPPMKRPRRIILRALTTLSLFLSLAALLAIPLSFFRVPSLVRTNQQSSEIIAVVSGYVSFHDQRGPGMIYFFGMTRQTPHTWSWSFAPFELKKIYWEYALGPRYWNLPSMPTMTGPLARRVLFMPLWLLAALFSLPKTLPSLTRSITSRLRHRPGTCRHCGYDLRATPDRCPECGTTPKNIPLST